MYSEILHLLLNPIDHIDYLQKHTHIHFYLIIKNDFLQLLSEVGLIGIGLLLLVFVLLFFRAVSEIRSYQQGDSKKYIAIGGMVGILGLMFHSLVERNIQVPSNAFLYTFLWALVLRISVVREKGEFTIGE